MSSTTVLSQGLGSYSGHKAIRPQAGLPPETDTATVTLTFGDLVGLDTDYDRTAPGRAEPTRSGHEPSPPKKAEGRLGSPPFIRLRACVRLKLVATCQLKVVAQVCPYRPPSRRPQLTAERELQISPYSIRRPAPLFISKQFCNDLKHQGSPRYSR